MSPFFFFSFVQTHIAHSHLFPFIFHSIAFIPFSSQQKQTDSRDSTKVCFGLLVRCTFLYLSPLSKSVHPSHSVKATKSPFFFTFAERTLSSPSSPTSYPLPNCTPLLPYLIDTPGSRSKNNHQSLAANNHQQVHRHGHRALSLHFISFVFFRG